MHSAEGELPRISEKGEVRRIPLPRSRVNSPCATLSPVPLARRRTHLRSGLFDEVSDGCWPARVDKNGLGDSYNVVMLCATKDDRLLLFEQGPYGKARSLFFRPEYSSRS
jgi:hypothetical protein